MVGALDIGAFEFAGVGLTQPKKNAKTYPVGSSKMKKRWPPTR
jgi:hypothetical protein